MHTGKIKKVVRERGFGFISDTDGREVFFHRNSLDGLNFEGIKEGQDVSFEVENGPKGPAAVGIRSSAA